MVADLTFGKITALALADAVNPCALAVLTLVLITVLTYNPNKKARVLWAGLMFTLAVYILYLFYGLILVHVFKNYITVISGAQFYFYKILAIGSILLGILNLKDFIRYRPGGFATEMPVALRPKVAKLISKITSPIGAFFIGVVVTLFLLPCSIGPYLIASGILSYIDFVKTLPWLLYYNLLFVLPMIAITLIVYIGYTSVERIKEWKENNVLYLHLAAGIILTLLGLAMLFNWL